MEAPRGPGYDDWFDEPEPPTETQSGANRGVYEDAEEVWVLPEEEDSGSGGHREIVIAGRRLTMTQVAIIALSVLAIFFALLAAFGVFSGAKTTAPPVTPPVKHVTVTVQNTTQTNTNPTTEFPAGTTLQFGDTGTQVKTLQQALISLGFLSGTADGDYGQATQLAVQKFQSSKGLTADGVAGPQTLQALQQAAAASG
jgi:Putative peptidoglycan binding domain